MGVESTADENQAGEDLATLQETLGSEDIVYVDSLNADINTLLTNTAALRYDYVIGDVSDYGVYGDNAHFDLVHDQATIHCVIFNIQQTALDLDIENGMQVAVKGNLTYYTDDGKGSLLTDDVVAVGKGLYQQTYEQNKQVVTERNLLDTAAKQSLPDYPQCIGIATSAGSDAHEDAITSIRNRHPGVDITIQDTSVQGDQALESILQAISALDENPTVDVIVLTRGGGADKHLRIFNKVPLCQVIYNTSTPLVVGIGHEADHTLAEEVADQRVMTPTEVGEIVPDHAALTDQLIRQQEHLDTAYTQTVAGRLADMEQRLDQAYEQYVTDEITTLATTLDHTYESLKQQKQHEREQAEAANKRRRQRIGLAALAILVLVLLGYILL